MNASRAILTFKYAEIVERLSQRAGVPLDEALEMFYSSGTYLLMSKGIADMHCMSVDYLVEEVLDEHGTGASESAMCDGAKSEVG